jgi:hypothetical protein
MSIFTTLGKKVLGSGFGQKIQGIGNLATRGLKTIAADANVVAKIGDKVSGVTGMLAGGAAAIGLEPVAAGLLGVSGLAKGVSKVAGLAGSSAGVAGGGIDAIRAGNVKGAISAGKELTQSAKSIQRMRK